MNNGSKHVVELEVMYDMNSTLGLGRIQHVLNRPHRNTRCTVVITIAF